MIQAKRCTVCNKLENYRYYDIFALAEVHVFPCKHKQEQREVSCDIACEDTINEHSN